MLQQAFKKDVERYPSFKVVLYYWSLGLNAVIAALLAVTMYGLFSMQPQATLDRHGEQLPMSASQSRPLVEGIVHHRMRAVGGEPQQQQLGGDQGGQATSLSSRQWEEHSRGPLRDKTADAEWKQLLAGKISEKMQLTNPASEQARTASGGGGGGGAQACGGHRGGQQAECVMCAGRGDGTACCNGVERKEVFLAIMCKSAPLNSKRRQAVRLMWDQMILVDRFYAEYVLEPQVYFAFVLGKVRTRNEAHDRVVNDGIEGEANIYGDMVVGDFLDSYTNLTTKLLFTLDWLRANLRFRYLMMADDDTFINVFSLLQWLVISPEQNFYAGKMEKDVLVVRDPESKWYVDRGFYGPETYPPYHQGFGYVVSCDAIERAMKFISAIPLFGIDDTVMGMLMYVVTVKPENMQRFFPSPYFCQMTEAEHPLVIGDVELDGFVRYMKDILYIGCPVCHKKIADPNRQSKT